MYHDQTCWWLVMLHQHYTDACVLNCAMRRCSQLTRCKAQRLTLPSLHSSRLARSSALFSKTSAVSVWRSHVQSTSVSLLASLPFSRVLAVRMCGKKLSPVMALLNHFPICCQSLQQFANIPQTSTAPVLAGVSKAGNAFRVSCCSNGQSYAVDI